MKPANTIRTLERLLNKMVNRDFGSPAERRALGRAIAALQEVVEGIAAPGQKGRKGTRRRVKHKTRKRS